MVKKVLTLTLGLLLSVGAMAQWGAVNPTVPQEKVQFWTGTGSNRAVVAITWVDEESSVGIVWGVQWNGGNLALTAVMDTIAAYDSRLTIDWNSTHSYINNLTYTEDGATMTAPIVPGFGAAYWFYNWKDATTDTINFSEGVTGDMIGNGDFVDWITMDTGDYSSQPADMIVTADDPNAVVPEESTFNADNIIYWVGEGSKQAVLAVNWADTALAWGYRFDGTKSVADMMDAIAAADPRFIVETDEYGLVDILFIVAPGDTLRKQAGSWWESLNNGASDAGMGESLENGDFHKWAEPSAGTLVGSVYLAFYNYWMDLYIYEMPIHAVSVPQNAGVLGVEAISMSVYPNPVADYLTISGVNGDAVLYDMRGSVVASFRISGVETRVNLSTLAGGTYMLRVGEATAKVVVKR